MEYAYDICTEAPYSSVFQDFYSMEKCSSDLNLRKNKQQKPG